MRISALSFIAAGSIMLVGLTAHADDIKYYPGAACSTDEGPTTRDMGRAWNVTATAQQLECPAVKDARRISGATVYVSDASNTQNFSCALYSTNLSLGNAISGYWETNQSSLVGHQALAFPTANFTELTPGAYHLWCSIPAKSADGGESQLIGYRITEQD